MRELAGPSAPLSGGCPHPMRELAPWSMQASCCPCSRHSTCPQGETRASSLSSFSWTTPPTRKEARGAAMTLPQKTHAAPHRPPAVHTPRRHRAVREQRRWVSEELSGPQLRSEGSGPLSAGITHIPDAHVFHQVSHLFLLPWSQKEEK